MRGSDNLPDDIEKHVAEWIGAVSHLWPGITPHPAGHPGSVWDLSVTTWLNLVAEARAYIERTKQQQTRRR